MRTPISRPVILLLENEANDVFFFRRSLKALRYEGALKVLASVAEARAYFEGRGGFADRSQYPWPDLIVSDSKLDDGTGVELFHWLRMRPASAEIPFVLFAGFAPPAVGVALVQAGASAFITKSVTFDDFTKSVQDILEFLPASCASAP
jgi:CheY-like chemotaxis protein